MWYALLAKRRNHTYLSSSGFSSQNHGRSLSHFVSYKHKRKFTSSDLFKHWNAILRGMLTCVDQLLITGLVCFAVVIWSVTLGNLFICTLSIQGNHWPCIDQPPKGRKSVVWATRADTQRNVSWIWYDVKKVHCHLTFCVETTLVTPRYCLMLRCWAWDCAERPTFTEIRMKLNELFGESCLNAFENYNHWVL